MRNFVFILCLLTGFLASGAAEPANYDEAKVGSVKLPPVLVCADGSAVTEAGEWTSKRRSEILELFAKNVYGQVPSNTGPVTFELLNVRSNALDGIATRKLVHIRLPEHPQWPGLDLMLYVPNKTAKAPVFLGLSFSGNHAVTTEPDVPISTRWMREAKEKGVIDHRATEGSRGSESSRWPLKIILSRGYAAATAYYGDIEPDHPEGWKEGLRGALSPEGANTRWNESDWGAISAWSWGLSRMLDYCESDPEVDAKRAAIIGHSRLGKTALWTGARDPRFAITISNESGEGGAALARRNYGETLKRITTSFPHWFCGRYAGFGDRVSELPVDQHMLVALMAPRPVYIASATEDKWADPHGEFLAGVYAGPVYALFSKEGLGTEVWPAPEYPIGHTIGYHLRTGKHDLTEYDWLQYLDFADRHFRRKTADLPRRTNVGETNRRPGGRPSYFRGITAAVAG